MAIDLKAGIVRILNPDGSTAGTGFVLSDEGLVATCAHVVQDSSGGPPDSVALLLHATGDEAQATVEPDGWRPADAEDVAILRLTEGLLEGIEPLQVARSNWSKGHRFETFGFPPANPEGGLWGSGEILGETAVKGVRLLQLRSPEVTSGFSGAPVWDRTLRRVVGMVTAIAPPDEYGRLVATAFSTPVDVLVEVWPEALGVPLRDSEEELLREMTGLPEREEQLRLLAAQRTPEPQPIDVLRQATKLFAGDWAEAYTGQPHKKLRQRCLTQASRLPHSHHLDMEWLDQTVDRLGRLEREIRILLDAWGVEPVPGLWDALERRGQTLGDCLRRIYGMELDSSFDLNASEGTSS